MSQARPMSPVAGGLLVLALLACAEEPTQPASSNASVPAPEVVATLAPVMSTLIGNAYDIGNFGFGVSFAPIIGASGNVTGPMHVDAANNYHAAFWSPASGLTDLGVPEGTDCTVSWAAGINGSDEVVGYAGSCPSSANQYAIRWTSVGGMQILTPPPSGFDESESEADAVNDDGWIAGWTLVPSGKFVPIVWKPDGSWITATLPDPYDLTKVVAINGSGAVLGYAYCRSGCGSAVFVWAPAEGSTITVLPSLDPGGMLPTGINNSGTVVGWYGSAHAFRWTKDLGTQDLGTLGGSVALAVGVADDESIAGYSNTASGQQHAFRWTPSGGMQDLGLLPNAPLSASGATWASVISSNGVITGGGTVQDPATGAAGIHAFRWTPQHGYEDLGNLAGGNSRGLSVNNNGEVAGFYEADVGGGSVDLRWARWNASTPSTQTATLTLGGLAQVYDGTPKTVTVSTTPANLSGVTVQYSQGGVDVATPTDAGNYDVVASLVNPEYQAPNASGVLVIAKAAQAITSATISDQKLSTGSLTLSATGGGSANPVTFASTTTSVCDVSATTVTFKSVGQCTILANQAGSANYEPATTVSRSFLITYDFSGFLAPLSNDGTLTMVKAGGAFPIKFRLGGDQGLAILASGSPYSAPVACASSQALDVPDEALTAGQSGLQYDPTTGEYTFVWKTLKSWSGQCRMLTIKLDDGTTYQASFKFK